MQKDFKWGSHALFGKIAFSMLPDWEKELVRPDMSEEAMAKPYIPEAIKTPGDKMAFMCVISDLIYYDECKPFVTFPDGRWIPHCPPDKHGQALSSGLPICRTVAVEITETLMNKMIKAIQDDDWETAIRHGGALAHYLQEPFTPGHAMDNKIFHELFPDPDPERHIRLHHAFDCASDLFTPLPPRLMGTSVAEAALRIQIEIDRGIKEGKKLVGPIIQSVYENKPREVRAKMLAQQSCKATFITSSVWHTAISIAINRFETEEIKQLESIDLTKVCPYFLHAWQYVDILPGCLVENTRKIPIHVWTTDTDGETKEQHIENGFGMGGHMGIKFFVNGDVYPHFHCRVGLPSRQTEGQDEHTDTTFFIEIDEEENSVYSEDIEYKAKRIVELKLIPGEPVHTIDTNISGARTLIIGAKCNPYTDPETGTLKFSIPHIAVCEPSLSK